MSPGSESLPLISKTYLTIGVFLLVVGLYPLAALAAEGNCARYQVTGDPIFSALCSDEIQAAKKKNRKKKKKKKKKVNKKTKKKNKKKNKKKKTTFGPVSIFYSGSGSMKLEETYKIPRSSPNTTDNCGVDTTTFNETVGQIMWETRWNDLNVANGGGFQSVQNLFLGFRSSNLEKKTDLSNCREFRLNDCNPRDSACVLFTENCPSSTLTPAFETPIQMTVTKEEDEYIVRILAEQSLKASPLDGGINRSCTDGSLFDNPIVDSNFGRLTKAVFRMKPVAQHRVTTIPVTYVPIVTCTDPARANNALSNNCFVTNSMQGAIQVTGPWDVISLIATQ